MVTCNEGYQNGGTTVTIIHCQSNLQWSYPGSCEKVCQSVPVVVNGIVSSGSNSPGARRQILCFPGYTLVGSSSTTCSTYGQWSTPGRCNQIRCQSVPYVSNGIVSSGSNLASANKQISCETGYTLQGSNTITCLNNGEWSNPGTCSPRLIFYFL